MKDRFRILANKVSVWAGSSLVFVAAIFIIFIWALSGPAANYSNTWQLVINTGTTIVTFLMVFLIQNTQNRDGRAMQLKLDELIKAHKTARDSFISLEDVSDEELLEITDNFKKLHETSMHTPAIIKIHKKFEDEHVKRKSIRGTAENFVGSILSPLRRDNTELKK